MYHTEDRNMTAIGDLDVLREKRFSDAVKRFQDLFVQSGRAFLIGAGCSKCAGLPLTSELTQLAVDSNKLNSTSKTILESIKKHFEGSTNSHIEDYLSELVDLLAIAERRVHCEASQAQVKIDGKSYSDAQLRATVKQIKESISGSIDRKVEIETHRDFVHTVHRPVRDGRAPQGSIVDYIVLNYDTVIEDALAIERIPFSDGIEGGVTGWWNPKALDRDHLAARVLKLHGSVDWCEVPEDPLPRRISPNLRIQDMQDRPILIWPASTKYREAQLDPFAQLVERARRSLRPSRGTQRVLIICGYSFGDRHINIEIERALHESSGDLTVVAFSSEDCPVGQLEKWNQDSKIKEQVLIFAKGGFFHGDTVERANHELPWWKFEIVVRLLKGEQ